jgi:predicted transcriptional regulator
MGSTTLGIKLDQETRDRLRKLGETKDRASHWLVKTAIIEYLNREERAEQERCEDAERWERYQTTSHFVGNEDAMDWLDALARGEVRPCPR